MATDFQPDTRLTLLKEWLGSQRTLFGLELESLAPASNDASFRRYFRLNSATHTSLVVMDAPPTHEDCQPFMYVARLFAQAKISVPQILAENLEQGFLLLTDLGQLTYLECLNQTTTSQCNTTNQLYTDAINALIRIQSLSQPNTLPAYDRALLLREMNLFPEWYVNQHLEYTLNTEQQHQLHQIFELLIKNNLSQPSVYVHRDYHSRNLMVMAAENNPGILDFQDAVYGPITYDLVSLLRDAYIEWPEEQVLDWVIRYWEKARQANLPASTDVTELYRDFEWMGLQRFLKVLGIFARLYHRDGKDRYLHDLPRVLRYTRHVAQRYVVFQPLLNLLDILEDKATTIGYTF